MGKTVVPLKRNDLAAPDVWTAELQDPAFWKSVPDWARPVIDSLLMAVKLRDSYTFGHICRVARGARDLATASGLNPFEQRVAEFAGLFHDLGKIGVPDQVLFKPSELTKEEDRIMRSHVEMSVEMIRPLARSAPFDSTLEGVRFHHERFDGSGYPKGLKGEEIPLIARIVTIADAYDAMTSSRVYRNGKSREFAYSEIQNCSGTQFDPHLAAIFLSYHPLEEERFVSRIEAA